MPGLSIGQMTIRTAKAERMTKPLTDSDEYSWVERGTCSCAGLRLSECYFFSGRTGTGGGVTEGNDGGPGMIGENPGRPIWNPNVLPSADTIRLIACDTARRTDASSSFMTFSRSGMASRPL